MKVHDPEMRCIFERKHRDGRPLYEVCVMIRGKEYRHCTNSLDVAKKKRDELVSKRNGTNIEYIDHARLLNRAWT